MLKVGDEAPPFEVTASDGRKINLADLRGRKNVVIYFYPKDFTRVCTAETCGFRDVHEDLGGDNVEIIGVSLDSDETHRRFAERYKVGFALVADENKSLLNKYQAGGMLRELFGLAKRVTYVIDKKGRIRNVIASELSADAHVQGVKTALAALG